ncbi:oxidoreductase [Aquimarina addita]|uniref:Oxidoreductase n=1 Tax=Aquimarina addita TaxID=870485 RepID=A0ABP7XH82_9FLAO
MNITENVWFITGVSSGFGKQIAKEVLDKGDIVVGTFRKQEQVEEFNKQVPNRSFGVLMDVTSYDMIHEGVKKTIDQFGKIDVLVNNAGYGSMGSLEEVSDKEIRNQFDVNVFGVLELTKAVLPVMRSKRSGHIINITSIGGRIGSEGLGVYNASKFALEGIGEALAAEVKPLNIKVTNVEPGPFKTEWAGSSASFENTKISDYEETVGKRIIALQNLSGNQPGDPVKAAKAIYELTKLENPPIHLPLGKIAYTVSQKIIDSLSKELADFEYLGKNVDFDA